VALISSIGLGEHHVEVLKSKLEKPVVTTFSEKQDEKSVKEIQQVSANSQTVEKLHNGQEVVEKANEMKVKIQDPIPEKPEMGTSVKETERGNSAGEKSGNVAEPTETEVADDQEVRGVTKVTVNIAISG